MVTQGELKIHDIYDSFNEVEYEQFMFLIDSMHESVSKDEFQFDDGIHEHASFIFHSEQEVEVLPSFYMHYESDDDSFVLSNELIANVDVFGEANVNESFNFPHDERNEN